jgi:two-component system OmpR family response regulator
MHLLYATDHGPDAYLVKALREAGHVVEAPAEPADALEMTRTGDYQALVLDWVAAPTPAVSQFAAATSGALVLVITGPAHAREHAAILAAGADACFVRPAAFIELEARLEALERLMRRARPEGDAAGAEMVAAERAVRLNGRLIALSGREFQVMAQLIAHAGEVVSLERLQQNVWGDEAEPRPDLVMACLSRLRRKLAAAGEGERIVAVAGQGHVFRPSALEPVQNENVLIGRTAPL